MASRDCYVATDNYGILRPRDVSASKFKAGVPTPAYDPIDIMTEILEGIADVFVSETQVTTEKELLDFARDFHALMLGSAEPVTRTVIQNMPNLKILSRFGIGYDNIDVKAATERGVMVTNVPDYGLEEVADHALMLALAITRKLTRVDKAMRSGKWDVMEMVRPINSPPSQVMGLLGFGNIARRVSQRAKPFGYDVIAFDPWVKRWDFSVFGVERIGSLEELLKRSDILSIHAPSTLDTRHLIGERELRLMKPSACIVNTSRGAIVDEVALIRALGNGTIAGASLDVYETEPLPIDSPLLKLENTILTPHMSWYTEQSLARLETQGATAVRDALTGRKPEFLLNPEVLKQ